MTTKTYNYTAIANLSAEESKKLIAAVHRVCPYYRTTKGNRNVDIIQL
tara:strand:+ start:222 stop:365 length:144 start_codon:yes stop_codon:yes gene_type:complete